MPHGPEEQPRSQALARALLEGLDAVGLGAALLSTSGHVVRANDQALRHVGGQITLVHGRLAVQDRNAAEALRQFLRTVQDDPLEAAEREHLLRLPRDGQRPLVARAFSVPPPLRGLLEGAAALVVLLDPDEHPCPTATALQKTFGLSRGEALIALHLIRGDSLREIAAARDVSIGTVRVQLKAIFAKTQTSRQSELVWLLARLAILAPSPSDTIRLTTDEGCSGADRG